LGRDVRKLDIAVPMDSGVGFWRRVFFFKDGMIFGRLKEVEGPCEEVVLGLLGGFIGCHSL
jgi:hypothetical protein